MGETKPQPLYKIELIGRKLLTGKTLTVKEKVWLANLLNATVSYRMADQNSAKSLEDWKVFLDSRVELDKYLLEEVTP